MSTFYSHECTCSLSHTTHATLSDSRPHSTHLLRDRVLILHTWALLDACNERKQCMYACIAFVTCKYIATATPNKCTATPNYCTATPNYCTATPNYCTATPNYCTATPNYCTATPNYCTATPNYCTATPNYCTATPNYCTATPNYCTATPNYCTATPNYCTATPNYCIAQHLYRRKFERLTIRKFVEIFLVLRLNSKLHSCTR